MGDGVMTKLPGWEVLLSLEVEKAFRRPFSWGEDDCVTFASDCVRAMTGVDPLASIRGAWGGPKGAAVVLMRRFRARTLLDAARSLAAAQGWQERPLALASRGDPAFVPGARHPGASLMGVAFGGRVLARGSAGLVFLYPPLDCPTWRVG